MTDLTAAAKQLCQLGLSVKEREAMKFHTSFKIGGPADIFVALNTVEQLKTLLIYVKENNLPLFVAGNGTNLLVSDEGIRGVVARLEGDFCAVSADGCSVSGGAGASLSSLCACALEHSLTGLEFAWGIPGSVGGAAFMNAGAYGGEMKDVISEVEYIDRDGNIGVINCAGCGFGYRTSIFQRQPYIVTRVTVRLSKGDSRQIKAAMDDVMGKRKDKQPLEMPSAGSVFKRPVGYFAGGLIQQCGLMGTQIGGAQVSTKHAGFIVNAGDATCADVLALVEHIQRTVREQTGVELECEIREIN